MSLLYGAILVYFAFYSYIFFVCKFWRGKRSEVLLCAIDRDASPVVLATFTNPKKSAPVVASRFSLVLRVFTVICFAQILYAVVVSYSVYVIYLVFGPTSVNIKPRQSVRPNSLVINAYSNVTLIFLNAPSYLANGAASGNSNNSGEQTSRGVVVKNLFKSILREGRMLFSHAVSPVKKWFGQRPASVISACGPRHFTIAEMVCI